MNTTNQSAGAAGVRRGPPGQPPLAGRSGPPAALAAPPQTSTPIRLLPISSSPASLTLNPLPASASLSSAASLSSVSSLSSLSSLPVPRLPQLPSQASAITTPRAATFVRGPQGLEADRKTALTDPHEPAIARLAAFLREPLQATEKIKSMKALFSEVAFPDLPPRQRQQIVTALLVNDNTPVIRAYWDCLPSGFSVEQLDAILKATLPCCNAADRFALESFHRAFGAKLKLNSAGRARLFSSVLAHRPALKSSQAYLICSNLLDSKAGISNTDFVRTTFEHIASTDVDTLEKLYMMWGSNFGKKKINWRARLDALFHALLDTSGPRPSHSALLAIFQGLAHGFAPAEIDHSPKTEDPSGSEDAVPALIVELVSKRMPLRIRWFAVHGTLLGLCKALSDGHNDKNKVTEQLHNLVRNREVAIREGKCKPMTDPAATAAAEEFSTAVSAFIDPV